MSIEARPYEADAIRHYRLALRERVSKLDERIFMIVEVPVQTPFTLDVLFDRLDELTAGLDRFTYIVNLSNVKRPDAKARERLRQRVARINPRLAHVSLVVGANAVIRAVAKLAAFTMGFQSFSFHGSVDEAVEACRRALR